MEESRVANIAYHTNDQNVGLALIKDLQRYKIIPCLHQGFEEGGRYALHTYLYGTTTAISSITHLLLRLLITITKSTFC